MQYQLNELREQVESQREQLESQHEQVESLEVAIGNLTDQCTTNQTLEERQAAQHHDLMLLRDRADDQDANHAKHDDRLDVQRAMIDDLRYQVREQQEKMQQQQTLIQQLLRQSRKQQAETEVLQNKMTWLLAKLDQAVPLPPTP